MPIRKDMGKYDSIKPLHDCDLANETAVLINPDSLTLFSVSHHCNHSHEDVEMALLDSHSRSPLPLHNANPLTPPASSKLDDAQFSSPARPILRSSPQGQAQRLASLDVFRGITVALMIVVDYGGGVMPAINHSPWDGLTLADLVMPFFLFIVGVSLALAYKKIPSRGIATQKAVLRTLKLLFLGLFLQGGFLHGINNLTYGVDIQQIRWMGILQRIAIAYFLAAVCEIWLKGSDYVNSETALRRKYQLQLVVAVILTTLYLVLSYGLYVPDWEYQVPSQSTSNMASPKIFSVKCGTRGDTGPACNAVGMIDRKIFGIQHLYKRPIYARSEQCSINSPDYGPLPPNAPSWCQAPFDPEGILSTVMAVVTCLVGLHYGHIIVHFKDHRDRMLHWIIPSSCLIVLALGLDFVGMHINKVLYTVSYMSVTTGAAGLLFTGIYLMVDVYRWRRMNVVMEWMGKHALVIYVLAACNVLPVVLQGFYSGQPQNNILRLIGVTT
ncbi:heparan-alpha-glucosaminide N-acetyltransferase-like [Cucurbita moschata]|uniref:Heparan-alpha-glucosaminide N-acetyltransferase-like n=1 Tax=Cucurbita moschata TaxID=3662 RepID=A0A6J1F5B2_CUCMO|nr:heparan-alpha-glucosaminide N-acetyltransferase-like [Cucurbita moschata]